MQKICTKCKENLSVDNFHKNKTSKDGLANKCKDCCHLYGKYKRPKYDRQIYGYKICIKCNNTKDIIQFSSDKYSKDGLQSYCIECSKYHFIQKKYKLSKEKYLQMLQDCNNTCEICDTILQDITINSIKKPVIDHCHKTGKVRAIICSQCNLDLGKFEKRLEEGKFQEYLDKYK